jgi:putative membrane protein
MGSGAHGMPDGMRSLEWLAAGTALVAVAAYLAASGRLRRRGDAWSWRRDVCFAAGGGGLVVAALAPGGDFTAHMLRHLVTGMAAPLLLVLARPLTLGLRALPPGAVRRAALALAHSRPATLLVFPPSAAILDVGGLWALYRTRLFAVAHSRPPLDAIVHLHVLAAGILFTAAVCQLDPVRRRYGLAVRGATLVAAGAAHAILAKTLWAAPPPGTAFAAGDVRTGAMAMYYGGDLIEIALAVVLASRWYAVLASRPAAA